MWLNPGMTNVAAANELLKPFDARLNWTCHQIFGRSWYTWSWNNVPANLRPAEILAGHLRAFQ